MSKLTNYLKQALATNFMLYFQAHVAHVNTVGRNFVSDHHLLGEIYEDAQENIDVYAEQLRILGEMMPDQLEKIMDSSNISDAPVRGNSLDLLYHVYDAIETLLDNLDRLYAEAEAQGAVALANLVQDRMLVHKKQCWMLRSISGEQE